MPDPTPADPTGAARTPRNQWIESKIRWLERDCHPTDLANFEETREQQHAATLAHLAGQAGPEVRGLVDAYGQAVALYHSGERPDYGDEVSRRRHALLAAYAAKDAELATYRLMLDTAHETLDAEGRRVGIEMGCDTAHWMAEEILALRQQRDEAEAAIAFLRDGYSSYGARPCPACVYENGKFIRLCKMCEERNILARRTEEAERDKETYRAAWIRAETVLLPALQQRLAAAEAKLAEAERAVDAARRAQAEGRPPLTQEGQLADWWDRYWASRSE